MNKTKKLTSAAMCLALGIVLPQAFHVIPNAGSILLPMHIPVLICGFIAGPIYGLIVGFLTPLISHVVFSMPLAFMLPQMLAELSVYGLSAGLFSKWIHIKNEIVNNYIVLILSMIIGRIIYGVLNMLVFKTGEYSLSIWLSAAFITGLPGISIQLLIIPLLVKMIQHYVR